MLRYLRWDHLFQTLQDTYYRPPASRRQRRVPGVKTVFLRWNDTLSFSSPDFQQGILHAEARVAHVEVMDLICNKFNLPCTLGSYARLGLLHWSFGHQLVRRDGSIFWSTESAYGSATAGVVRRRRDVLHVHGSEYVGNQRNALCCESICFFTVSGLSKIDVVVPGDSLTFVLGRWFRPHRASTRRDSQFRPICPAPLDLNHSL